MNAEETKPADVDFELRAIHSEHRPDRADHDDAHFAQNVEGKARFAEFVREPSQPFEYLANGEQGFGSLTASDRASNHIPELLFDGPCEVNPILGRWHQGRSPNSRSI